MNSPQKHPSRDNDLTKDQLAEHGIKADPSGADSGRSENYQKDLAEEATWPVGTGKHEASPKPATATEAETKGEDNDYYNGMSQ